jgi:hypothetical protein
VALKRRYELDKNIGEIYNACTGIPVYAAVRPE